MNQLTPEQHRCVTFSENKNLIIEAGAGAGKTAVLAERVLWKLNEAPAAERVHSHEIMMATFTKAADKELKHRVQKRLVDSGNLQLTKTAHLVQISTIDSLLMTLFNSHFAEFWEATFLDTRETRNALSMVSCPQPQLVDTHQVVSEMERELPELIANLKQESHCDTLPSSDLEALLCDFLLSGALKGGTTRTKPTRSLILEFLISEPCLLLSEAPPEVVQKTNHPALAPLLKELIQFGRQKHIQRIRAGQITHTDRLVFLHNLYCASDEVKKGSQYHKAAEEAVQCPLRMRELIVDEYQDTNPAQHQLLSKIAGMVGARMIVVGDPKQSLYGFRRARVSVFHDLKKSSEWQLIELVKNFRSAPALLREMNLISKFALGFIDPKVPATFWESPHGIAALRSKVDCLDLAPGRVEEETEGSASHPRVTVYTHSLNKSRYTDKPELPDGIKAPELHQEQVVHAIRKVLQQGHSPSDCVILCETNGDCRNTAEFLRAAGIASKTSSKVSANPEELRLARRVAIAYLLKVSAKNDELSSATSRLLAFEILTAPPYGLAVKEAALCVTNKPRLNTKLKAIKKSFDSNLEECRALAKSNVFAAWRLAVQPVLTCAPWLTFEMEEWAIRYSTEFENRMWRDRLQAQLFEEDLSDLPAKLGENVSIEKESGIDSAEGPTEPISIMTVHGAKGLQWPVVFFLPKEHTLASTSLFRCLEFNDRNVVQWQEGVEESLFAQDAEGNPIHDFRQKAMPSAHSQTSSEKKTEAKKQADSAAFQELKAQEGAEQLFERSRVFYTAITRAQERLVLFSGKGRSNSAKSIRDNLSDLVESSDDAAFQKIFKSLNTHTLASYLDARFQLRSFFPEGKKTGKIRIEPWIATEKAELKNQPTDGDTRLPSVAYYDQAVLTFEKRAQNAALIQKNKTNQAVNNVKSNNENQQTKSFTLGKSDMVNVEKKEESFSLIPDFWKPNDTDAESVQKSEKQTAEVESSEPSTDSASAEELSRLEKIQEGILFHAERELTQLEDDLAYSSSEGQSDAATQSSTTDSLRLLEQQSSLVQKEFEIWTPPSNQPDQDHHVVQVLQAPARHIIDLLCLCDPESLPCEFSPSETMAAEFCHLPEKGLVLRESEESLKAPKKFVVIVDYKTGKPKPEHLSQMIRYAKAAGQTFQGEEHTIVGYLAYLKNKHHNENTTQKQKFTLKALTSASFSPNVDPQQAAQE